MENTLNQELEFLIEQLNKLNAEFKQCFKDNKKFDESKQIFLRIKEANQKLKLHFSEGIDSKLFEDKL